jgi:hypothetical protein
MSPYGNVGKTWIFCEHVFPGVSISWQLAALMQTVFYVPAATGPTTNIKDGITRRLICR